MVGGILEECLITHFGRFMGSVFHKKRPILTIIKIPLRNARVSFTLKMFKNNIVNICPPLGFGGMFPSI